MRAAVEQEREAMERAFQKAPIGWFPKQRDQDAFEAGWKAHAAYVLATPSNPGDLTEAEVEAAETAIFELRNKAKNVIDSRELALAALTAAKDDNA